MSFGGANIDAGWLAGLGPAGTTTTSRIINVGGRILVVGNSSDNFTIQGFQVRGSGDGGQFVIAFDLSGAVQWVQSPIVGLPVPTGVTATAADGAGNVAWSSAAKELLTGYQVDVSGRGVFSVNGSSTTALDLSGLVNKTTYPVRVRGVNATKQSEYSATVTVRPMPVPPAPTGLGVLTVVKKSIDVSWSITSVEFVDGFTVDVNGVLYDVSDPAARTTRISGVSSDVTYAVKVRSYNNAYASTYTPTVSYTVPFIASAPIGYRSIAAGGGYTAALLADGTVRTWGAGSFGRLGIGSTIDMSHAVTPCNILNAISISTGTNHTAVLLADGTVRTWGFGGNGQLGIGSTIDMLIAVTPCNIANCVAIAAGNTHTAALLANGTMRTWGNNSNGELGIGSTAQQSSAVTPCNLSNVIAITVGSSYTAALLADGTMRTWGFGGNGRLGINSTIDMSRAVTPCNVANIVAIAAANSHTAALLVDGTMRTWGSGASGELGYSSTNQQNTAVTPCNISNAVAIAAGVNYTAALLADGTMRTWGIGTSGRLGNGLTANTSMPVTPTSISNVVAIATAGNDSNHVAILLADGTMRTWGEGTNGRLGIGSTIYMSTAVTPCNISNVLIQRPSLERGAFTLPQFGMRPGQLFTDTRYGYNPGSVPALGIAVTGVSGSFEVLRDGSAAYVSLAGVSESSAVLIRMNDYVRSATGNAGDTITFKAWNGMTTTGALTGVDTTITGATIAGNAFGSSTMTLTSTFQRAVTYRSIAVGESHTAALLADGTMRTWGTGFFGQLGIGSSVSRLTAVTPCNISNIIAVAAGFSNTAALLADGTMRTWGGGSSGQLGNGSTENQFTAVTPCNISNVIAIASSGEHMAVLLSNGTMRTWGEGSNGRLGIGSTADMSTAVTPCNVSNVVAIAASDNTAALLADGTMRIWGSGTVGTLGNGSNINRETAVTPTGVSNIVAIACGRYHTAALLADGTMRTWGFGVNGQLGIGSTTEQLTAVTPCNISNIIAITAGLSNTAALLADGTMRTWGYGVGGALGINSTVDMSTAVTPCNISNVVAINSSASFITGIIAALIADGTMRIWGNGGNGRLGIGSTTVELTAVTPCNISNVMIVRPAFKSATITTLNNTINLYQLVTDLSNCYQPGTVDSGRGIAIVGVSGTCEYSINSGSTWTALGAVSAASAVLLRAEPVVRIRFTNPNTGTLSIKAWSEQQATPALATAGVDTTVSGATYQAFSFGSDTISWVNTLIPAPPVPVLDVSGVGNRVFARVTSAISPLAAGYTFDFNGTTYNTTTPSYALLNLQGGSSVTVKALAYNADLSGSDYSVSSTVTVTQAFAPITYRSIAAGSSNTAALLADGTMRTWGVGASGRLGIGSIADMSTAVTPCNVSNVIAIAYGAVHTAALLADGTMRMWGAGLNGQLGYGSTASQLTAVTPCNISNVVAITTGRTHVAALLADGTMRTWGGGFNGRLGIPSYIGRTTAVTPCNISNVVAISIGSTSDGHTVTLLADGTVRTWGNNFNGQLGIGSTADMSSAVTPIGVSNVVAIAGGADHTAVLLADGTMRTWGAGSSGRLGINSTANQLTAVTPCNVSNVVAISAGSFHTAALLADGTMRTWGAGGDGALGIGSTVDQLTAVTPCNVSNVVAIAAGERHTAALFADGTMRTWGNGNSGGLGIGSNNQQNSPVTPCNISNVMIVKPSRFIGTTFAPLDIFNNDRVDYIVRDLSAVFVPGTMSPLQGLAVVGSAGTWEYSINGGTSWVAFPAVSAASAVALTLNARVRSSAPASGTDTLTVKAWSGQVTGAMSVVYTGVNTTLTGATIAGQSYSDATATLKNNVMPTPPVPTIDVSAGVNRVTAIIISSISRFTAGYIFDFNGTTYNTTTPSYALLNLQGGTSVTVKALAYNVDLSGSDYSTASTVTVTQAVAPITYKSIAVGACNTVALLADGTMRMWGRGGSGQLGIGSNIDMSTAVTPCNISNVVAISVAAENIAGLLADGTMRIWGAGTGGRLGNGGGINVSTPVTPCNVSNIVAMSINDAHTAVLLADGTMRTWGSGLNGRLGISSTTQQTTPVTPCNISNAVAIVAGFTHTAALLADGTVRMWGAGTNGRLGIGSVVDMSTAVTPCNVSNVIAIASGTNHMVALLADSTMKLWGNNTGSQLGNGGTADMSTAVTLSSISNVVAIGAGAIYTVALLADGTMRTWGLSINGALGTNVMLVNTATPVTPCNISNAIAIAVGTNNTSALLTDGTMRIWGAGANGQLGIGSTVDMSTAVTPCNISNVMIVKPTRFIGTTFAPLDIFNGDRVDYIVRDLSAVFVPGTIGPYQGLAVTGRAGTWEYSINGGTSWVAFPAVTDTSAVVLTMNARVRSSAPASGTDTLTVKAWSGQIVRTAAVVYTGVNTTLTSATIDGLSYSSDTATLRNNVIPTPPVPTDLSAVGGVETLTVTTLNAFPRFISSYTINAGAGGTYSIASVPSVISGVAAGTYSVRARAVNADGLASADSSAVSVTVLPIPAPITYRSIAAGNSFTASVLADGTTRTWGSGGGGGLGNGLYTASQLIPVTPTGVNNAVTIQASLTTSYTAALLADGTLRMWGDSTYGKLGIGSTLNQPTAVTPCNISNVVAIAVAANHAAVLLADGTMRTWGLGASGQLGIGSTVSQSTAVTPCNLSNIIAIAAGGNNTACLLADGTMRTWGEGIYGVLGIGSTVDMSRAVTPCNISNIIAISGSDTNIAALLADGTMRIWGERSALGIGVTVDMSRAVTPCNISNVVAIAAGTYHTAVLLVDGTMRTWGGNSSGKLGDGSDLGRLTPVTPCNLSNVVAIANGRSHTISLLADGTMRTWGDNFNGQLGINSAGAQFIAVTPCNISNVAIVRPSFANRRTTVNRDLSFAYFMAISTGYQPGTVPYRGLAIVGATGAWEYSTNSGSTWTTVGAVTTTSAVALRLEPTVRIRCTVAGVLSVRAWSAQQATPATVTTGVDTTVATATIQGISFSTATTTITAA